KSTNDRNGQRLKVRVGKRHFLSPNSTGGPSVGHASNCAGSVPSAENGGNPPFSAGAGFRTGNWRAKCRRVSPTFGGRTVCGFGRMPEIGRFSPRRELPP